MNFNKNLFSFFRKERAEPRTYTSTFDFVQRTIRGADLTELSPEDALNNPIFYACIDLIRKTVANLNVSVLKDGEEVKNELVKLLKGKANKMEFFPDIISQIITDLYLYGNGYLLPIYEDGLLKELIKVPPTSVEFNREAFTYLVNSNKGKITVSPNEILHFRLTAETENFIGKSILKRLITPISQYALSGLLTTDKLDPLNPGTTAFIAANEGFQGAKKAVNSSFVKDAAKEIELQLSSGKRVIPTSSETTINTVNFRDSSLFNSLTETKESLCRDICRVLGVPPELVFTPANSNYRASKNSYSLFISRTILPLISIIERELSNKLAEEGTLIKFATVSISQDPVTRTEDYKNQIETGLLTINEARALEGRNPVKGGDEVYISCNVQPITTITTNEKQTV